MSFENDFSTFVSLKQKFENAINNICYPITLPNFCLDNIDRIDLCANNMPIVSVDVKLYPKSLYNNGLSPPFNTTFFIPFYTDKCFNIYELDAYQNEISLKYYNNSLRTEIYKFVIKKKTKDEKMKDIQQFLIREWDGSYKILKLQNGVFGFPV